MAKSIQAEIAELENELGITATDDREKLAGEIDEMEKRLAADDCDDDDDKEGEEEMTLASDDDEANDDDDDDDLVASDDDDDDDDDAEACVASETAPGVEDRISQEYLKAMEELRGKAQTADAPKMIPVAPTRSEYKQRLVSASQRLDKVASYLEADGKTELAMRVDRVSDAIDAKLAALDEEEEEDEE